MIEPNVWAPATFIAVFSVLVIVSYLIDRRADKKRAARNKRIREAWCQSLESTEVIAGEHLDRGDLVYLKDGKAFKAVFQPAGDEIPCKRCEGTGVER